MRARLGKKGKGERKGKKEGEGKRKGSGGIILRPTKWLIDPYLPSFTWLFPFTAHAARDFEIGSGHPLTAACPRRIP